MDELLLFLFYQYAFNIYRVILSKVVSVNVKKEVRLFARKTVEIFLLS